MSIHASGGESCASAVRRVDTSGTRGVTASTSLHDGAALRTVAADNPDVVKRLLALAEKARADLGDVDRPGANQRKAGWVDEGRPLLLKE